MTTYPIIVREGTEILHGNIRIAYPPSYGTTTKVKKDILADKLKPTNFKENISFIDALLNNPNLKASEVILQYAKDNFLWCFTEVLFIPDRGLYIRDVYSANNEIIFNNIKQNTGNDTNSTLNIKFVPLKYNSGPIKSSQISKDPLCIALAGKNGAKNLENIARAFSAEAYISLPDNTLEPEIPRIIAINTNYKGKGLGIYLGCHRDLEGIGFGKY